MAARPRAKRLKMASSGEPRDRNEGFVRLAATSRLHCDPDQIVRLLDGPTAWLPGAVELPPVAGQRRFAVDLRLRIGGEDAGLTTLSKAAYLDVGHPQKSADGWVVEVAWRAAGAAPLFPVFSGWLEIHPDALEITGLYAPPAGPVGRIADRALLHIAANGTARWLLRELDRASLGSAA